jgi:ribosome-associated toxin RatA of RatAB toxin-antitoxin module
MQTVERVVIKASPTAIWEVLTDVERWPMWTPTVLSVEPVTRDGFKVGAKYRVTQPKIKPAIYEVTERIPHQAFTWVQKAPGATMIAEHRLTAFDGSGTEVELAFATKGLLGALTGSMNAKLIADYVKTEAKSLKQHCEMLAAKTA